MKLVKSKIYGVKKVNGKCVLYKKVKPKTKRIRNVPSLKPSQSVRASVSAKTPKNLVVDFPKDIKVSITNPKTNEKTTEDYVEIKKTAYPSARARKEAVEEKPIVESKADKFTKAELKQRILDVIEERKLAKLEEKAREMEEEKLKEIAKQKQEAIDKEEEKMKKELMKKAEYEAKVKAINDKLAKAGISVVGTKVEAIEKAIEKARPMKERDIHGNIVKKKQADVSSSSKEQEGEGKDPSVRPDVGKTIADEYKEQIFNELPEPIRNLPIENVVYNTNYYMHNPYTYDPTNPHIDLKAQLKQIIDADIYGKNMDIHGANQHRRERPRLIEDMLNMPTDIAKIINSYDEYKQGGGAHPMDNLGMKNPLKATNENYLVKLKADRSKLTKLLIEHQEQGGDENRENALLLEIDDVNELIDNSIYTLGRLSAIENNAKYLASLNDEQLEQKIDDINYMPTNVKNKHDVKLLNQEILDREFRKEEDGEYTRNLEKQIADREFSNMNWDEGAYRSAHGSEGLRDGTSFIQEGGALDTGLDNLEIVKLMKDYPQFCGVVASDRVDGLRLKNKGNPSFIMNLDKAGMTGSHWVACYIDKNNEKEIDYYDPLGDRASDDFMKRIKKLVDRMKLPYLLKFKWNSVKNQTGGMNCGLHAIQFLKDRYAGKSFKESTGYVEPQIIDNSAEKEQGIDEFKKEIIEFGLI